ncbi:MAG TPA: pilus assembly protein N-terminal domain-containing protein, partial [Abditibacterium sp.]
MIRPLTRRVTSSGRALISLLALGIVFQPANRAGAYSPPQTAHSATFKPQVAFKFPSASASASASATAPRAALMPRAAVPAMPRLGASAAKKAAQTAASNAAKRPTLRWARNPSDGEMAALFPAPPSAAGLKSMKKVIDVPALALPPLSKPLPSWMQNAAVRVEKLEKGPTRPAPTRLAQNRIAQNRTAAPVRNPGAPVTSSDRLANQIEVATSTFVVLLTTTDLQTVAVADPGIADVAVVNSRSVLLNGKTSGVTSLVIVDGQKIRQYTVRVTAAPGTRPVDVTAA